jgi:hypothetical protein
MSPTGFPDWLHRLSIGSIDVSLACALFIALDEFRRPQRMWIMNVVWPSTALFGSVLWLAGYLRWGRAALKRRSDGGHRHEAETPMPIAVAKGASHCGAGCALGDLAAEWLAFVCPGLATALGWGSLFQQKMYAVWVLDFIVAFGLGVAFQYFTIKPMRQLSVGQGLWQAVKADTASISSWQIGMYGFMAVAQLVWFRGLYGRMAEVDTPEFWFAMQLAMLCGFATAYPVNWVLVSMGVKEKM